MFVYFSDRVVELNPSWDKVVPGNLVAQLLVAADEQTVQDAAKIFREAHSHIWRLAALFFCIVPIPS
jgi:hypothetical protein